jgi:LysR family transcriptional regulator, glycine cleavage system transcriptional activator
MNKPLPAAPHVPHRALGVGPLRAFEAVARRLSFRAAAEELHLTQPAISRQISGLETELGFMLFARGTRKVELTSSGASLRQVVQPWLAQLDAAVLQLRNAERRQPVSVTSFASLVSLWLLPRLTSFQQQHPAIDIRVSASDRMVDFADPEIDLAIRYVQPKDAHAGSTMLFDEVLTPVASPALVARNRLKTPADLARHTLLEEDDPRPSAAYLSWHRWLSEKAPAALQPRGWIYLNYTYQQIQACLAGQGVALARLSLVIESIERGELVEPFGKAGRVSSPYAYWLVHWPGRRERAPVAAFEQWLRTQGEDTRARMAAL